MSTFDFLPPDGWVARPSALAQGVRLEREASGKGAQNPTILVRIAPVPGSVDAIPDLTPSELRAQAFDTVDVGQQRWHSPPGEYPYFNQLIRAERGSASGGREEVLVGAIHIVMSDESDPGRKQLLSFELRFHRDDDEPTMIREFSQLVSSTTAAK